MWHSHYITTCPERVLATRALTSNVQVVFETLMKACLEAPLLAFVNFDKPFLLETNASKLGLGVVLSQKQPNG